MDTVKIREVLEWMRGTDIVELAYRKDGAGFALNSERSSSVPAGTPPPTRFVPVCAESVGVFQWAEPGKPRRAEEGKDAAEGDSLGIVVGSGATRPVKSPCAGRIAKVLIDAGQAVEYGRPLFLLEPRA